MDKVTIKVKPRSDRVIGLCKELLKYLEKSNYNKSTLSITNKSNGESVIVNSSSKTAKLYVQEKLYLRDPVCEWEDKALFSLTRKNKKVIYGDFETIHNGKFCQEFLDLRKKQGYLTGGSLLLNLEYEVLTLNLWSSLKDLNFMENLSCENKRMELQFISSEFYKIFLKNKNIFFDIPSINSDERNLVLCKNHLEV